METESFIGMVKSVMPSRSDLKWDYARWICLALAVLWLVLRWIALESSPPGFFIDEVGGALNIICLRQTGHTFYGAPWPTFPVGAGGGVQSPTFTYFGVLWSSLFGDSIASFRAISAFFSVGTAIGLFFLARFLCGLECALFTVLAASLSPWSFQFARLSWDAPLFPFFIILGLNLLFRSNRIVNAVLAGVAFALAAYTYSGGKVQAALLLVLLFLCGALRDRVKLRSVLLIGATAAVACLPLAVFSATPLGRSRMEVVSILAPRYLRDQAGGSYFRLFWIFISNVLIHLGPGFLFLHGDANARHSPQGVGELGGIDILAVGLALALAARMLRRGEKPDRAQYFIVLLSGAGILTGIAPAALTWEGIPHALRAMGAWPFVSLASGWVLWRASLHWRAVPRVVAGMAIVYSIYFAKLYFVEYPRQYPEWFDAYIQQHALQASRTGKWKEFLAEEAGRQWVPGLRFYSILYHGDTCASSAQAMEALGVKPF